MTLEGPYLAGCLLMVLAGYTKAARPDDTARALSQLLSRPPNLRTASRIVRLVALLETSVALSALLLPGTPVPPLLVGASFAGFTAIVAMARAKGGVLASCGCFGKADTPPTVLHMLVTSVIGASAITVAVSATTASSSGARTTLWANLSPQPWHGVPLLFTAAALAAGSWVAMTLLPKVRPPAQRRSAS
jgi:hypothetical protein